MMFKLIQMIPINYFSPDIMKTSAMKPCGTDLNKIISLLAAISVQIVPPATEAKEPAK